MFSSIGFLSFKKLFLSSPPRLAPNIFLNSISACLPISFLISDIKGVTVLFIDVAASMRDLSVLVISSILSFTFDTISAGSTLASTKFWYSTLGASVVVVSATGSATCLASSVSKLSALLSDSIASFFLASNLLNLALANKNSPKVIGSPPAVFLTAAGSKFINLSTTPSKVISASSLEVDLEFT